MVMWRRSSEARLRRDWMRSEAAAGAGLLSVGAGVRR